MNADSGSRALTAINDLIELLRLAHSAAERLEQEVYGPSFEHADLIARDVGRLRRSADALRSRIESFVSEQEASTAAQGHPLRRQSDRAGR